MLDTRPPAAGRADGRTARWARSDLLLGGIVLWGAWLRVAHLGRSRLGYDEAFSAMAARRPLGGLVAYLTAHDSHPPLDYLVRAPFARAGMSEFWIRVPSATFSIAALVVLACWLRGRPRLAILATALMAAAPFQILHGRDARMYALLELLGVSIAFVSSRWLDRPRPWLAAIVGALVLLGLLDHVSMFLYGAGLLALVGLRRDRDAWIWRAALAAAGAGWALLWGSHFLVQARGGHSAWIPRTTPSTLAAAVGGALAHPGAVAVAVSLATVAGTVLLVRRRDRLARVVVCLVVVPIGIGAVAGLVAPVTLDRTFTLMAWGPVLAIALLLDALVERRCLAGTVASIAVVGALALAAPVAAARRSGPDIPLRALERRAAPGDIIAVRPRSKAPEVDWVFQVRHADGATPVALRTTPPVHALRVGTAPFTGRIWLLDWHRSPISLRFDATACAPHPWRWGRTTIRCVRVAR